MNKAMAAAISKDKMSKKRKKMWTGGSVGPDEQDLDLERDYRTQKTAGEPGETPPKMAKGGTVCQACGGRVGYAEGGWVGQESDDAFDRPDIPAQVTGSYSHGGRIKR